MLLLSEHKDNNVEYETRRQPRRIVVCYAKPQIGFYKINAEEVMPKDNSIFVV